MGDLHTCPMSNGPVPHVGGPILPPCAVTVLIEGLPAARAGDQAACVGPPDAIAFGSTTVYTRGQPQARITDPSGHGGLIALGCFRVFVG